MKIRIYGADSIADLGELSGVPTPTIGMVLTMLKLRAGNAGVPPAS